MGETISYQAPADIPGPDAPTKAPAQGTSTSEGKPAERPAHIPEKFWKDGVVDVEGMSKAYAELEKKQSQPKPDEKKGEEKQDDLKVEKPTDEIYIPGVTKSQSDNYAKELIEAGQLSEKSYAELAKAGYPKQAVDAYLAGIRSEQASQEATANEMKAIAGGEDGYKAMSEWMVANLTDQELNDYNDAVRSGKKSVIKMAVESMTNRYRSEVGSDPKLLGGKSSNQAAGDRFESRTEMTDAMRDPRYKRDEAYRKRVADKIARSAF